MQRKLTRLVLIVTLVLVIYICGWTLSGSFKKNDSLEWKYSLRAGPVYVCRRCSKEVHKNVKKVCEDKHNSFYQNLHTLDNFNLHYLLVNEKHKLCIVMYQRLPALSGKKVMIELEGVDTEKFSHDDFHDYSFKRLKDYSVSQRKMMIRTYTKFMFVREPFERIVSAFRDKFEKNNTYFRTKVATDIIREHRPRASQEALKKGDDLKFSEFVNSIAERNPKLDEHWTPGVQLCQPCLINYDFIGFQETLERDAKFVLHRTGLKDTISFPDVKVSQTHQYLDQYFKNISTCQMRKVLATFEADFKMFRYAIPYPLRKLTSRNAVC